jgi:hypothetical protein
MAARALMDVEAETASASVSHIQYRDLSYSHPMMMFDARRYFKIFFRVRHAPSLKTIQR